MGQEDQAGKAVQSQKLEALGRFAGGMAHDFNNILSIIEGYAHVAVKQLKEGKLDAGQLEKIVQSTQRGAGLTRQLLAFARQKVAVDEKHDLADLLRRQDVLLRPLLGATVNLWISVPDEPVWVAATEDQITQAIFNLALNARDAMPDGGDFIIECRPPGKSVAPFTLTRKYPDRQFVNIGFIDNGTGIPEDIQGCVFEPFFTTKPADKGTGLGLSVVYGIVDQLGGEVNVWSRPGTGSVFDIWLPLTAPLEGRAGKPEAAGQGKEGDMASLAGKTILVAEDEPELRDVLAMMFDGMDMKVLAASNGNHALMLQEEHDGPIDFLLTDVVMPEMDGAHLGRLFTSLRPDSNVIYMSGYPFLDSNRKFDLPDDADFISKPLQEDKVKQILARALERRDARRSEQYAGQFHQGP